MAYKLDPINRFAYIVDENGHFHSPSNDIPAIYYLDTHIPLIMNHGKVV